MRIARILGLIGAGLLAYWLVSGWFPADAEDHHFSVAPSPTPTYPAVPSIITVRFVSGGEPVTVELGQQFESISVNGMQCQEYVPGKVVVTSEITITWPRPNCGSSVGDKIRITFAAGNGHGEVAHLVADLTWAGNDIVYELDAGPIFAAAGDPFPSALPATGGPPNHQPDPLWWLPLSASLSALAFVSFRLARL